MLKYDGEAVLKRMYEISGLKQEKLAEQLGISQGTISKIKQKPPSGDILYRFTSKYKCSADYLLGIDAPPAADQLPTYPEFIRCLDAIVSNKLGVITNYSPGDKSNPQKAVVIITDPALVESIKDYTATINAVDSSDSYSWGKWLRKAWFEKELKKDLPLTKDGMTELSYKRDCGDWEF